MTPSLKHDIALASARSYVSGDLDLTDVVAVCGDDRVLALAAVERARWDDFVATCRKHGVMKP